MRIAVPVWSELVSPVLDTAQVLRIYEIDNGKILSTKDFSCSEGSAKLSDIVVDNADILICGALSYEIEKSLLARGLKVHPWVMGECDTIINHYLSGKIKCCEYTIPGCRNGKRNGCSRQRRNFSK